MKPKLINLTPHVITIIVGDNVIEIQPQHQSARVDVSTVDIGHVDGIPLVVPTYGDTLNLPDPQPGVFLIVSNIVLAAHRHRFDLLTPSRPIRDESGQVVACGALSVVDPSQGLSAERGTETHAHVLSIMKNANGRQG